MLKLTYLFENFDLAKEAIKNWNYDADTLETMLSYFRQTQYIHFAITARFASYDSLQLMKK